MIPADKILTNQYTRGNEFIVASTREHYQGYYCIVLSTKYYTGKTYTDQSKQLLKYIPNAVPSNPTSLPPQTTATRYFLKKINQHPIIIKEIDEMTYNIYQGDPFYQLVAVQVPGSDFNINSKALDDADKQMPGLKIFLSV
jgi:hypothetical protein